jgi:hypothetical protein
MISHARHAAHFINCPVTSRPGSELRDSIFALINVTCFRQGTARKRVLHVPNYAEARQTDERRAATAPARGVLRCTQR